MFTEVFNNFISMDISCDYLMLIYIQSYSIWTFGDHFLIFYIISVKIMLDSVVDILF